MARIRLIFAGLAMLWATSVAAGTPYLKPGTYAISLLVEQAYGEACIGNVGDHYSGILNYDGLNGDRAGLRILLGDRGLVSVQSLTVTGRSGVLEPYGTFTWFAKGLDGMGGWSNMPGTFGTEFNVIDSVSFSGWLQESYGYGSCDEAYTFSATRIGPHMG